MSSRISTPTVIATAPKCMNITTSCTCGPLGEAPPRIIPTNAMNTASLAAARMRDEVMSPRLPPIDSVRWLPFELAGLQRPAFIGFRAEADRAGPYPVEAFGMRMSAAILISLALLSSTAAPTHAKVTTKTLGTDPAGDGLPALDVTYLKAGRVGADLYIEIGVDKMLPPDGGIHQIAGIDWAFGVKGRTFIVEASVDAGAPDFFLFEILHDGSHVQLGRPTGEYKWSNGYIHMRVPLKSIGAKSGTVISHAAHSESGSDVSAYLHPAGVTTHYTDTMKTTRDFVVP